MHFLSSFVLRSMYRRTVDITMQALHFHLYLYKGKSFYYNRTFQFYRKKTNIQSEYQQKQASLRITHTCLMMDFSLAIAMTVTHTDMSDPRKSQNCRTSYSMMQNTTIPGWSHAWQNCEKRRERHKGYKNTQMCQNNRRHNSTKVLS